MLAGLSLELSSREKFGSIQVEVLIQILDFPICCIHLNFSLSSKLLLPNCPLRLSPGLVIVVQDRFKKNIFKENWIEPAHEIMALIVLRNLILQTCMRSHPVGLDVWFLDGPFVYFHTSCVQTAKALSRMHGWPGWPEPSPVACEISTIISWAGSIKAAYNTDFIMLKKEERFQFESDMWD